MIIVLYKLSKNRGGHKTSTFAFIIYTIDPWKMQDLGATTPHTVENSSITFDSPKT